MRRLTCILLVLVLLCALSASCFAAETEGLIHNYILIIDNSLSTTNAHSLGEATDPRGMRFDAARLVYENVLSSAKAGNRGKICVIVFCGPEHCAAYGPMEITEDAQALHQAIGQYLSDSYPHQRDGFTDIRTALMNARDILAGFEGDTSVFLLTDGINALTNSSDPFQQPVNIEANDQSVETAKQIYDLGADFYVVALTAKNTVSNTDAFMEFINRMALAGGGEPAADGGCSNVLKATQTDLNSKLLQILIKSESAGDAGIQTASHGDDGTSTFRVPYEGISDETINLTFMPEEKEKIKSITLVAPDNTSYTIFENGQVQDVEGISVSEDRSYLMLDIASPQSGQWQLTVDSDGQAEVNSVVRFNQNLRICTDYPQSAATGESVPVQVWVQQFDGEEYVDLADPDFYAMSTASMYLSAPGEEGGEWVTLEREGDRFVGEVSQEMPGLMMMGFQIANDFWSDEVTEKAIKVLPALVGTMSASGDTASAHITTGSGGDALQWQVDADPKSGVMTVSWGDGGDGGATAVLRDAASGEPVMQDIHPGDTIDMSQLEVGREYELVTAAEEAAGGASDANQPLGIKIVPDAEEIDGAAMDIAGAVVKLAPVGTSVASSASVSGQSDGPEGLTGRLKNSWIFIVAAVAAIAVVVTLIVVLPKKTGEKVTGRLKIVCEPLQLQMLLQFDGAGKIRVNSPLTKHPDIAKLKGGKIYNVLSHVQVSMSKADRFGMVSGSEVPHMPNESLITLTCPDPQTGDAQVAYAGRLDAFGSVLHVYDAGRVFDVYFTSNMDLHDLTEKH